MSTGLLLNIFCIKVWYIMNSATGPSNSTIVKTFPLSCSHHRPTPRWTHWSWATPTIRGHTTGRRSSTHSWWRSTIHWHSHVVWWSHVRGDHPWRRHAKGGHAGWRDHPRRRNHTWRQHSWWWDAPKLTFLRTSFERFC